MDVVLLAGSVGPDPAWTQGTPRPLLPLPGTTVVGALLSKLRAAFAGSCIVCANGETGLLKSQLAKDPELLPDVQFLQDRIPLGTAGCIKACEPRLHGDVIFVAGSSVWLEDDPSWMVEQHLAQGNALTVFCRLDSAGRQVPGHPDGLLKPIGLYCCDPVVMEAIPARGYRDLKEQLVPALQRAGHRVGSVILRGQTREISDWEGYLHCVNRTLAHSQLAGYRQLTPDIWCGNDVTIADDARIVGPALLGHGCTVSEGALVIGPALLGDGSVVGKHSRAMRVIAPYGTRISEGETIADRLFQPETATPTITGTGAVSSRIPDHPGLAPRPLAPPTRLPSLRLPSLRGAGVRALAATGAVAASFVWAFWHSFADLWSIWQTRADYGAGQLVPLAAVYMIGARARPAGIPALTFAPWGLAVFGIGLAANLLGSYYLYASLENLSLVICANGLAMTLLGWHGYKRIAFPLLFLLLMIPLPGRLHDAVMIPLQGLGAMLSAGILEIVGMPVLRYGHVLDIGGHQIAVAEACNGLRMALAFLMVASVVAFMVRRPTWQKATLMLSSIPIAIACNVVRIVVTASLYGTDYEWMAEGHTHEIAGLLMMPAAICLILLELRLLSKVTLSSHQHQDSHADLRGFGGSVSPGTV